MVPCPRSFSSFQLLDLHPQLKQSHGGFVLMHLFGRSVAGKVVCLGSVRSEEQQRLPLSTPLQCTATLTLPPPCAATCARQRLATAPFANGCSPPRSCILPLQVKPPSPPTPARSCIRHAIRHDPRCPTCHHPSSRRDVFESAFRM